MSLVLDAPVRTESWQTPEYLATVYAVSPVAGAKHVGCTEPRIGTPPLRPLTPETSLGFEVIEFAEQILGVVLYPWQRALLIRALELRENGEYRFRRIVVLVARQQGKTTLAGVLAAWWLFVDSARHPDRVPPMKFKVVGVAQTLDIAREPWDVVKLWCDPKPETAEDAELAVEALQDATAKVTDTNGKERITARSRAHYEIRAAKNARGKPAAKVLMDEGREQKDWSGWNAVSQTTKSFWNGQLWLVSNAGDATAVVLKKQREAGIADAEAWNTYVGAGIQSAEDYANSHDVSLGLFEWSAPDGCDKDDVEGILAANPSIGYGAMTVATALADIRGMTDAGYRTEVLCQWVESRVEPFMDPKWSDLADAPHFDERGHQVSAGSQIAEHSHMLIGIDTSWNRSMTYVSVAGYRDDGLIHVEIIKMRAGMLWVVPEVVRIAKEQGITHVAVQSRGCPAADFVQPLKEAGLEVVEIFGTTMLNSAGRLRDRVRDELLRHRGQPILDMAMANGIAKQLSGLDVWDRAVSVVDVAPAVAVTNAVLGLETTEKAQPVLSAYAVADGEETADWW